MFDTFSSIGNEMQSNTDQNDTDQNANRILTSKYWIFWTSQSFRKPKRWDLLKFYHRKVGKYALIQYYSELFVYIKSIRNRHIQAIENTSISVVQVCEI